MIAFRCCPAAASEEELEQALEEAKARGPSKRTARAHRPEADTNGYAAKCAATRWNGH